MKEGAAFRGQPLLLLGALIGGWVALRIALWVPPFEVRHVFPPSAPAPAANHLRSAPVGGAGEGPVARPPASSWAPGQAFEPHRAPWSTSLTPALGRSPAAALAMPRPLETPRVALAQTLLFLAGMAEMNVPSAIAAYLQPPAASPAIPRSAPLASATSLPASSHSGWSADGWLLLRRDDATALTAGEPSYGRSQIGAVVRYRLSEGGVRPQAYLRASGALAGPREQEVAAGLSARPFARIPVRVAAEARLSETARGTDVRPAVFAVTDLPVVKLPLGARGEAYVQAGYVGGDFATAFVDGQARIERPVARLGDSELTGGGAIWGGAQKDAARLDVGPTAAISFRLGEARGRVAADYRFRVAGDAQPASGPALTVSAGF